jgi:hypothetical protein
MQFSPLFAASLTAAVLMSAGALSATSAEAAQSSIFRCDLSDGSVVFADRRCKGAKKVVRWQPERVPLGIQRTPMKEAGMTGGMMGKDNAPTLGYKDPYVDCRERGGKFNLTARLCRLPSEHKPVVRIR